MRKQTILIIALLTLLSNLVLSQTETWEIYNTSNSDIPDDWVWGLDIDSDQNAWIGTVGYGLAKFDGTNWTIYNASNSDLPSNTCFVTAFESNGDIWEGTMSGVSMFDGSNWTSLLGGGDVWDIEIDSNNHKWVATLGSGLAVYNNISWTYYSTAELGTDGTRSIEIDDFGIKWIGTDNGLVKYDGTNWTIYNTSNSPIPNNSVISLEIDQDDNIWIGTGGSNNTGGLAKFDRTNWTVYTDENSSLPSNYINDLMPDNDGNIWIATGGTQPGGLVKFDGDASWKIYNSSNSDIPNNRVSSIAIDSNGCIWAGTSSGVGVLCFDATEIETTHIEPRTTVHIYPNPTKGLFTVENEDICKIEILNIEGKVIKSYKESTTVDLTQEPDGIYIIKVQTDEHTLTRKLIKQ